MMRGVALGVGGVGRGQIVCVWGGEACVSLRGRVAFKAEQHLICKQG
jgi:hypothetical protein